MGLANVQGPRNEIEKKQAICRSASWIQRSLQKKKAVTETWVNDTDEDSTLEAGGFGSPIRLDLICQPTGKTQGGEGVCLYINYKWCRHITVREQPCSPGCCPGCWSRFFFVFFRVFLNLLKELPQIFVLVVNIHVRWIKSLKQEKPLTFWEMPHRCSADFCRHLSK